MELQDRLRRRFTYAMLFYVIGFALCFTLTSVLLKDLSDAFHLTPGQEGNMSSITSAGSLIALVCLPFLQGRVRKSWVLAFSGLAMLICIVLKGVVPGYGALLAVFFVFGLALGCSDCYCNAFIVDLNGANANRYLGALHAFSGVGAMLAPLFITWIRAAQSWQNTYFIMAGIIAVPFLTFLGTCFYMRPRLHASATQEARLRWADIREYVTNRENLVILACHLLYTMFFNGFIVWVTLYIERVLGAPELRAYPLAVFWVFAALARFFSPRIPVRPAQLFRVGTALGGVALLIGVLSRNAAVLIVCSGVCGLLAGPGIPVLIGIGCARYQDRSALPSSLLVIMQYAATTISPLVMAAISDAASLQESMIFTSCCALAAAAMGCAIRSPKA